MSSDIQETTSENPAQTIRDVMEKLITPTDLPATEDLTKPSIVAMPSQLTVTDLSAYVQETAEYYKPTRRRGTAHLYDLTSIIAWANRFKGDTSALFAKPDDAVPSLTCIADYHAGGEPDPKGDETARHCQHRAVYKFPLSREWQDWMRVSGNPLDKNEMGEFIEAHAQHIMDPTPAMLSTDKKTKLEPWEQRLMDTAHSIDGRYGQLKELLQISREFAIHEKSDVTINTNRDTGERQIQFVSEHKTPDGKPIKVPNLIIIAIPVFQGGALYRMPVRFRYRKSGGSIIFLFEVFNADRSFEAAFDEAIEQARQETDLPLFRGSPEA